jgi:hypothetical protein
MPVPGPRPRGARCPSRHGAFHLFFLWLLAFATLALGALMPFAPRAPAQAGVMIVAMDRLSHEDPAREEEEEGSEEERSELEGEVDVLAGDLDHHAFHPLAYGPGGHVLREWPAILLRAPPSVDLETEGEPPRA